MKKRILCPMVDDKAPTLQALRSQYDRLAFLLCSHSQQVLEPSLGNLVLLPTMILPLLLSMMIPVLQPTVLLPTVLLHVLLSNPLHIF